jgi:futalosine hydrolase
LRSYSEQVVYGARVILVVAATERELEHVEGAETFVCGIGPVESALATARRLAGSKPTALIQIGIAGAQTLEPPSLVVGSEAVYCDVADPQASLPRVERVSPDGQLLDLARSALPHAHVLPIGTTGRVGGGAAYEVEAMEGFGVLRAAALAGVPALEVRTISNLVAERDRARWQADAALAALAEATRALLGALDA